MTARPTIASPLYPVISAYGTNPALGVTTNNLVRYAVGQPQLIDPGGYINTWSYNEDTGTLSVTYNAIATQLGPINAPHFQWTLYAFDGTSVSGVDGSGDSHFVIFPLVTDINYSGSGSDRPSVAVGFSDALGSVARGCMAIWNKTSATNSGVSLIRYTAGAFVSYTGLDTAPAAGCIGTILTYDPGSIYNTDGTALGQPRASNIFPTGDYDTGQEASVNVRDSAFLTSRYLDVWLGAAEWSGGTGSVPPNETISFTVAAITLPFMPRFLGSNFIKQP